jgi:predicted nucleic acid-binding protein
MNLEDIVGGSTVLIDTNVLLYARNNRSAQCRRLLQRCEQGAVTGVVTLPTMAEFSHRCMVQEAQANGLVGSNPARALSEHPDWVRQLRAYAEGVRNLLDSALTIVEWQSQDFLVALELQKQYGLLTNDSLNLAIARRHGIQGIATADKSFDAVQGLIVYKPADTKPPAR